MPSWKRVIVSGSDAALNSLNITTSLTASGNIYPTGLGIDRQVLKTDGAGSLTFGYAEEVVAIVKNVSGGTLQKGTPVHATASGAMGNVVGIIAALASDPTTMPATFVLNETLLNGAEGEALSSGFIQGVNTGMFEVGQIIYVGEMGGYTGTKPTGSNLIQNLGIVTKVSITNGSGFVLGAGRSNDLPNIQPGYAWVGNSDSVPTAIATSSIQNVVSSSFAQTASFISATFISASAAASGFGSGGGGGGSTFPFTGSAIISGSLEITGSLAVQDANGNTNIDSLNRQLYGTAPVFPPGASSVLSVDWASRTLNDSSTRNSIEWNTRQLKDNAADEALTWMLPTRLSTPNYLLSTKTITTQNNVTDTIWGGYFYEGDTIEGVMNTDILGSPIPALNDLVFLSSSGLWFQSDNTNVGSENMLGIYVSALPHIILLKGHIAINDDDSGAGPFVQGATYGVPIYQRDGVLGEMSTTPANSVGRYVRVLGHMYWKDPNFTARGIMNFNPSNDWIQL